MKIKKKKKEERQKRWDVGNDRECMGFWLCWAGGGAEKWCGLVPAWGSKLGIEVWTQSWLWGSLSEPSVCVEWGRTGSGEFSCQRPGLYPAAMCVWVDPWHQSLWRRVMRVIRSLGKLYTAGLRNSEGQPPSKEREWESALRKACRAAVGAEGGPSILAWLVGLLTGAPQGPSPGG